MRIFVLVLMGLVLVGCSDKGSSPETTAAPTVTVTAEPTPEPTDESEFSSEEVDFIYLTVVRDLLPEAEFVDDAVLLENAKVTCEALDAGMTNVEVMQVSVESGIDAYSAGVLFGAAIPSYCPEYTYMVE